MGHVAHALFVWGVARAAGGRVLIRIEDHDQSRHRPEYESAILEDLAWLGFEGDAWHGQSVLNQRDRDARYHELADHLRNGRALYACTCSRADILARTGPQEGELRYDGHCRDRGLPFSNDATWRLRLPESSVEFSDLRLGSLKQSPWRQCGDVAIRDRHGHWTYQFAVVADDWDQGIDLVVRGEDLLESTGRQMLLAQMLGRQIAPQWLHHPLLLDDTSGQKLSKRAASAAILQRRLAGEPPENLLGEAAWRVGLTESPRPIRASDVPDLFRRG